MLVTFERLRARTLPTCERLRPDWRFTFVLSSQAVQLAQCLGRNAGHMMLSEARRMLGLGGAHLLRSCGLSFTGLSRGILWSILIAASPALVTIAAAQTKPVAIDAAQTSEAPDKQEPATTGAPVETFPEAHQAEPAEPASTKLEKATAVIGKLTRALEALKVLQALREQSAPALTTPPPQAGD